MFATPLRYGPMRNINVLTIGSSNIGQIVSALCRIPYSTDKGGKCCKELSQTENKRVEPWPKAEPPLPTTCWRAECSREPQPPNYDPYRIKVPDVVVPPLPPSNVKWTLLSTGVPPEQPGPPQHQQYGQPPYYQQEEKDESKEGLVEKLKGLFDKIRGKSKGGEDTMMELQSEDGNPDINFGGGYSGVQDLFYHSPVLHPDYWKGKPERKLADVVKEILPKLGYHGRNKYKYAFHEPWRPLDRMTLLEQAEKEDIDADNGAVSKHKQSVM